MIAVTVTVGRNWGKDSGTGLTGPMALPLWHDLIERVQRALEGRAGLVSVEVKRGRGTWDGVREDSAAVTGLFTEWEAWQHANLKYELRTIRGMYGQDAIALSVGESELIGSEE